MLTMDLHNRPKKKVKIMGLMWLLIFMICNAESSSFYIPAQPKENVWVTLANETGQEAICLALSSPGNPFSTCLVGIPLDAWPCPSGSLLCNSTEPKHNVDNWDSIIPHFPSAALEPQELEILGSIQADACIKFNWTSVYRGIGYNKSLPMGVNSSLSIYQNESMWCNYTAANLSRSSNTPIALPKGVFLICGDRAWPAIPSRLAGGPCTLGRLTLLTPNISMIYQQYKKHREKRMAHAFTSDCNDQVEFWNPAQAFFGSVVPGVGTAHALTTLRKLGCWLSKQTNATSLALSDLLLDVDSVRHATLQNRAAIDFLLLAQGHGCEEFEGMCCMNLSDHSTSIHAQIQQLQKLTHNLQKSDGWDFGNWLKGLGITGWLKSLIVMFAGPLLVLLCILLFGPCILQCILARMRALVDSLFEKRAALLAQRENGGSVESFVQAWLEEKGHSQTNF